MGPNEGVDPLAMAAAAAPLYSIRPSFAEKFRPAAVKPLIGAVLAEKLADKSCAPPAARSSTYGGANSRPHCRRDRYNPELTAQWTREIADEIKNKLKTDLELPRYKFVVQVVVGEQRGEGVRMGCRCFWDADTDNYAEESYRNVSGALDTRRVCPTRTRRRALHRKRPSAAGRPLL
jgi:hypothetical protein